MANRSGVVKATDGELVRALVRALQVRSGGRPVQLEWLRSYDKAAPKSIFIDAAAILGDKDERGSKGLTSYWNRHKADLAPKILEALGPAVDDTSDPLENGAPSTPQKETNIVRNVAIEEPEAEGGSVDNAAIVATVDRIARNLAELTQRMTAIEQRVDEMSSRKPTSDTEATNNLVMVDIRAVPPVPGKTGKAGKKHRGGRGHVHGNVDQVIYNLFEAEVAQHSGNRSKALNAILWRYFDKPRLSFEIPEEDNQS